MRSWIEARLEPRRARLAAREGHAIMQPERPILPELDRNWHDAIAAPVGRPRHWADGVLCGYECHRFFEGKAAFQRRRLVARPGADLRAARARRKVGIGLGVAHARGRAADAHLALER